MSFPAPEAPASYSLKAIAHASCAAPEERHPPTCPSLPQLAERLAGQSLAELHRRNAPPWVEACPTCSTNRDRLDQWMDEIGYPDYCVAAKEVPRAHRLWHQLAALSNEDLGCHIELTPAYVFWGFARLLIEQSEDIQATAPERSLVLAHAGVSIATVLDHHTYLPALVLELQTRAWLRLSDARRLAGQRDASYLDLRNAQDRLRRGAKSALCEARFNELLGALLWTHEAESARELAAYALEQACEFYERAGLESDRGRSELRLGSLHHAEGRWNEAILHLTQALLHLAETPDPPLHIHCLLRLASALEAGGYAEEAQLRRDSAIGLAQGLSGLLRDVC